MRGTLPPSRSLSFSTGSPSTPQLHIMPRRSTPVTLGGVLAALAAAAFAQNLAESSAAAAAPAAAPASVGGPAGGCSVTISPMTMWTHGAPGASAEPTVSPVATTFRGMIDLAVQTDDALEVKKMRGESFLGRANLGGMADS